jgi:LysM repeat protein
MGILLFQMLSGAPPFRGTLTEVLNAHVNIPAPRLDAVAPGRIPPVLADVLQQALAKRAKNRYPTVKTFQIELLHAQAQLTHSGSIPSADWTVPRVDDTSSTIRSRRVSEAETRLTGTTVVRMLVRRKRNIATLALGLMVFVALASVTYAALLSAFRGSGEQSASSQQTGPIGTQLAPRTSPIVSQTIGLGSSDTSETSADGRLTPLRIPAVVEPAPQWFIQLAQMDWSIQSENVVSAPAFMADSLVETGLVAVPVMDGLVVDPAGTGSVADAGDTPQQLSGREHIVQSGDSLSKIAGQYGIDVGNLQWWNGIRNANSLSVGQSLKLYASGNLPPREEFFAQISQGSSQSQEPSAPAAESEESPHVEAVAPTPPPAADNADETSNPIKKLWRKVRGKS